MKKPEIASRTHQGSGTSLNQTLTAKPNESSTQVYRFTNPTR